MTDVAEVNEAEQTVAIGKRFQSDRKRFQTGQPGTGATLQLSADGSITEMTPAARHMLEYKSDQPVEPCFFSHVHGRNLYQVMRDVADMVCYGKTSATWLARLRTGQGRWRWYKATVENGLNSGEGTIAVSLRDLHEW
jgi:PAS domain-containing protein